MTTTVKTKHGTPVTVIGTAPPFRCNGKSLERVRAVVHGFFIEQEITMNVCDLVGYDGRDGNGVGGG